MKKANRLIKVVTAVAMIMIFGINTSTAYASAEFEPTIRIGENAPMTREEFFAWNDQRGIRHISIEERIYPLGIFFHGNSGRAFAYNGTNGRVLYVSRRPGITSEGRIVRLQENYAATCDFENVNTSPSVLFCNRKPIHLFCDDLTAIIENAPACPMHTRSKITLPDQKLTETELEAWIDEYNEMGGASAFEIAVVREVNRVRAEYGLHPLVLNSALMMSARLKTQEFGDLQYFRHESPIHGSPTEAANMFGFEGLIGENIARSGSNSSQPALRVTPECVVAGMLASTRGHREVLLDSTAHSVGVGAFFSPNSTGATGNLSYSFYFATKFGFE